MQHPRFTDRTNIAVRHTRSTSRQTIVLETDSQTRNGRVTSEIERSVESMLFSRGRSQSDSPSFDSILVQD